MEGRILVFSLTFCVGVLCSLSGIQRLLGLILLTIGVGVTLAIISIAIYQSAWLKLPLRPVIGKSFLALILWSFPAPYAVLVGLMSILPPLNEEEAIHLEPSILGVAIFTIVVGAVGLALCNWVKHYDQNDKHWLCRSVSKP